MIQDDYLVEHLRPYLSQSFEGTSRPVEWHPNELPRETPFRQVAHGRLKFVRYGLGKLIYRDAVASVSLDDKLINQFPERVRPGFFNVCLNRDEAIQVFHHTNELHTCIVRIGRDLDRHREPLLEIEDPQLEREHDLSEDANEILRRYVLEIECAEVFEFQILVIVGLLSGPWACCLFQQIDCALNKLQQVHFAPFLRLSVILGTSKHEGH